MLGHRLSQVLEAIPLAEGPNLLGANGLSKGKQLPWGASSVSASILCALNQRGKVAGYSVPVPDMPGGALAEDPWLGTLLAAAMHGDSWPSNWIRVPHSPEQRELGDPCSSHPIQAGAEEPRQAALPWARCQQCWCSLARPGLAQALESSGAGQGLSCARGLDLRQYSSVQLFHLNWPTKAASRWAASSPQGLCFHVRQRLPEAPMLCPPRPSAWVRVLWVCQSPDILDITLLNSNSGIPDSSGSN